jgi:hypothetical protein
MVMKGIKDKKLGDRCGNEKSEIKDNKSFRQYKSYDFTSVHAKIHHNQTLSLNPFS